MAVVSKGPKGPDAIIMEHIWYSEGHSIGNAGQILGASKASKEWKVIMCYMLPALM